VLKYVGVHRLLVLNY